MKVIYTLKRPGAPVSKVFRSTCRFETFLFTALGYTVRKTEVLHKEF